MADRGQANPRLALMSPGLYRLRKDIASVSQGLPGFMGLGTTLPDVFVGWGHRPSGRRAVALGKALSRPSWLMEDGFLKGFSASLGEPSHSYVLDRTGVYFDTARANDLEILLSSPDSAGADQAIGADLSSLLAREEISKFNDWPQEPLSQDCPFVLLVDQVPHDASIAGAGADASAFATMVRAAADDARGRQILVRTHPSSTGRDSPLLSAARQAGIEVTKAPPVNPWKLIKAADEIYTISSQMGLEGLIAGKTVHCFGQPFYSGRGLTQDHGGPVRAVTACSAERLVGVFYGRYLHWLDVHDRTPCSVHHAIGQLLTVRDQRRRLPKRISTFGMSPWKRNAIAPFLTGMKGRPQQFFRSSKKNSDIPDSSWVVAKWGVGENSPGNGKSLFLEDGFIRSVGLGVKLTSPASLTIDSQRPHYDCRASSDVEEMLQNAQFDDADIVRARALIGIIVSAGVTKYNIDEAVTLPSTPDGATKILVPGQVEADASIRYGSPHIRTNRDLVSRVRKDFPDAFVVYKPHPDVVAGFRDGGASPVGQDLTVTTGCIEDWIEWADRIETMTSWTGFEALLRGKQVGVHGAPIYAGWGLTADHASFARRTRLLSLEQLASILLVRYPFYIDPTSRLPCEVEKLVAVLAASTSKMQQNDTGLLKAAAVWLNRRAVIIRDRKSRSTDGDAP